MINKYLEGEVILIDKPYGWTSFDVVNQIRWELKRSFGLKKIKVGHAGTLDPLATGLLIVCTGKMTKKIDEIQVTEKEYIAKIELGAITPSYDKETDVSNTFEINHINKELVIDVLKQFEGEIMQVPPLYSAKFVNGKRAYELARQGSDIELKAVSVNILNIELLTFDLPFIDVRIKCSKGTYIRTIANDIGKALNSGAHLSALRRTASGNYNIDKASTPNECKEYIKYYKESLEKEENHNNRKIDYEAITV